MIIKKKQKKVDSKIPPVLYKKTYSPRTGKWNIFWFDHNFKQNTGFDHTGFQYDKNFWLKRLHPDDRELTIKKLKELENGKVYSIDIIYRWRYKDGNYRHINDCAVLIKDSKKRPLEIVGSWVDISRYAQAEMVIKENEEQYKKIIELSPYAIFIHNDGVFRFLNHAALILLGIKNPEDVVGKSIFDFIHPNYHDQKRERMKEIFSKKKSLPLVDYKLITLSGEVKDVEITSSPMTFEGKLSAQDMVIDMSKFKLIEDIYKTNNGELERLNKILMKRESEQIVRDDSIHHASFDEGTGILLVGTAQIKIKKFSKQYDLLRIIFKDTNDNSKDWQFSEISEDLDIETLFIWKRFYNVAEAIRKKIAIETGIKDFFILTTQSIKINPKYLVKS